MSGRRSHGSIRRRRERPSREWGPKAATTDGTRLIFRARSASKGASKAGPQSTPARSGKGCALGVASHETNGDPEAIHNPSPSKLTKRAGTASGASARFPLARAAGSDRPVATILTRDDRGNRLGLFRYDRSGPSTTPSSRCKRRLALQTPMVCRSSRLGQLLVGLSLSLVLAACTTSRLRQVAPMVRLSNRATDRRLLRRSVLKHHVCSCPCA